MRIELCAPGSCCPAVEVSQTGTVIGEGDELVKLTPQQWNMLVEKVKSGELPAIDEMATDCGCGCGGVVCSVPLER